MGFHDPTDDQLYDLMMLGLAFMRRPASATDTDVRLDRANGAIFRALTAAGAILDSAQRKIKTNGALIRLIHENTQPYLGRVRRDEILGLIETSEKNLLAMVPHGGYRRENLVGPQSYGLVITKAGLRYADAICPTYAEHITPVQFAFFWTASLRSQGARYAGEVRSAEDGPRSRRRSW